jgi:hypothetical protein
MTTPQPQPATVRPFQFTFWHVAELMVGLGLAFGLWRELGPFFILVVLPAGILAAGSLFVARAKNRSSAIVRFAAIIMTAYVSLCMGMPMVSGAREGARRMDCCNHLRTIAVALHAYHDDCGCFPPAVTRDDQGRPMHSWRALILKYTDAASVHEQYDFTQAWDSEHNRQVARQALPMLGFASCPSSWHRGGDLPMTNYFYVVGPGRTNDATELPTRDQIAAADGLAGTVLLVESDFHDVDWFQPVDVPINELPYERQPVIGPPEWHYHRAMTLRGKPLDARNVAFADGSIRLMRHDIDPDTMRALLTIDGGEQIDLNELTVPNRTGIVLWLVLLSIIYVTFVIARRWPRFETTTISERPMPRLQSAQGDESP